MNQSTVITRVILFVAIAVVVNLIAYNAFFRLDFTADQRYSLSKATKDIVKDLDETVTVTAYFSSELPPQLDRIRRELRDKLVEYQNASSGNIVYRFIDPDQEKLTDQEMMQKGIMPTQFQITERDKVETRRGYMAAEVAMGTQTSVLPMIVNEASMEYDLTKSIKEVSVKDKPKVGILQGHGEAGMDRLRDVRQQLNVLYEVTTLNIEAGKPLEPAEYKAIAIINPQDSIPAAHLSALDDYLSKGGGIFLALSSSQIQQQMIQPKADVGFRAWLADKGINLGEGAVISARCGQVQYQQQMGMMNIMRSVEFPYFPIIDQFADHPVSKGLEAMILNLPAAITYTPEEGVNYTALAKTHELSATANLPVFVDVQKRWQEADFQEGSKVLALAAEGKLAGDGLSRLVVVSDGGFALSEQNQRVNEDNANLAVNAIDWLADQTGLIDLRTKTVVYRPLDKEGMSDLTRETIKYANLLAPVALLLGFGLYRRFRNNARRTRWIEGKF